MSSPGREVSVQRLSPGERPAGSDPVKSAVAPPRPAAPAQPQSAQPQSAQPQSAQPGVFLRALLRALSAWPT